MIYNSDLTIYHKSFDETTKLEKWIRYNYERVWLYESKGANANKGYEESNNVEVRIPLNLVKKNQIIEIGDIVVKGKLKQDITRQSDLGEELYNIVTIKRNNFGTRPHIHITGK